MMLPTGCSRKSGETYPWIEGGGSRAGRVSTKHKSARGAEDVLMRRGEESQGKDGTCCSLLPLFGRAVGEPGPQS